MSRARRRKRLHCLEPLEPRIVLDASFVITEFLARNEGSLLDEDGDSSDWIEIDL